ncbi:MAG: hypothetical protein ACE5GC_02050 [Acidimicrobiia bacterium]
MSERGFAAPVLVVVLALVVFALGGVTSDLWRLLHAHRVLSGEVDAAASAAASALDEAAYRADPEGPPRLDPIRARELACAALSDREPVDCPGPDVMVDVVDDSVTVTKHRTVSLLFVGRFLTAANSDVLIEASARVSLIRGGGP